MAILCRRIQLPKPATGGDWQYVDTEGKRWIVNFSLDGIAGRTGMHVFKIEAVKA